MKINNVLLIAIIFLLRLIAHTMEYNQMHEITKQQEGTFYTVSCSFFQDKSNREYTYKVLTNIKSQVGDLAVVEINTGYKLVVIKAVHNTPAIDYNAKYEYRWLVDTVALDPYIELRKSEEQLKKQLDSATWEF